MNFIDENIDTLTKLEKEFPNNMELGNNLRRLFRDNEFIISNTNDQDLGKEVRKIIQNL
jgi:hypothetical protein